MSPISTYFIQPFCDRCDGDLSEERVVSFFNSEIICGDCSKREAEIRAQIRARIGPGADDEYEGCGFVPRIKLD
jgi:hypothetical protein